MPAFQRQFVWGMEQIEKLWDAILLDYTIATFLFWHVDDSNVTWDTYFCGFLSDVTFDNRKQADSVNYNLNLDWTNKNFKYEQDHLHPDNKFNESKPISVSMEDWRRWRGMRNRLPNLHRLEVRSNGSKNDMRLVDYYNDMNDGQKAEFYKQAT